MSVYLVCDSCGYFFGDVGVAPFVAPACPECAAARCWSFKELNKALAHAATISPQFRSRLSSVFPLDEKARVQHGGQGKGLKRKTAAGTPICGRCGQPYDSVTAHGPCNCPKAAV